MILARRWRWLLPLGVIVLPLLNLVTQYFYLDALLASGQLDPDHDSIGIPLYGAMLLMPVMAGVLAIVALLAWLRWTGSVRVPSWDQQRWLRSVIVSALLVIPAVALLANATAGIITYGWVEALPLPFTLPFVGWLLLAQGALLQSPEFGFPPRKVIT